jgi:hypothetical protein
MFPGYDRPLPENKDRFGLSVRYELRLYWTDKPHEPKLNSSNIFRFRSFKIKFHLKLLVISKMKHVDRQRDTSAACFNFVNILQRTHNNILTSLWAEFFFSGRNFADNFLHVVVTERTLGLSVNFPATDTTQ